MVITVLPLVPGGRSTDIVPDTTVDGHPAYSTTADFPEGTRTRLLNVYGVQGFEVDIQAPAGTAGAPVRIFHGLRLLGPDRAAWTTRPLL